MKIFTVLGILFWGNLFSAISRLRGITATTRFICRVAKFFPLSTGELGAYSDSIDVLFRRFPFLFVARKQPCLVRGLLIYFFGKRRLLDVQLHFGSRITEAGIDTHCWIVAGRQIRFEVEDVINQYTTLVEYN